ncbi:MULTISPECIES: hypothetical protein [unclassified Moorena]|uniref:hypothetical protein n=1 Tax=unclassified Moorena TaxID=2683338 RepID=UPI0013FFFC78|nr:MULTISPECIES: hypothetical protein [unclassified Moorena]NEO15500.1 hypothetical protein [Moorena sp. SIO3E8]NEQ01914.1 hypothetical protein [Moorena sp. SIO3F7]
MLKVSWLLAFGVRCRVAGLVERDRVQPSNLQTLAFGHAIAFNLQTLAFGHAIAFNLQTFKPSTFNL